MYAEPRAGSIRVPRVPMLTPTLRVWATCRGWPGARGLCFDPLGAQVRRVSDDDTTADPGPAQGGVVPWFPPPCRGGTMGTDPKKDPAA